MSDVPPGTRLDSWKAIAEYLQRDLATVRRWEKSLGLPVHRVAGSGRSVFAYTGPIDTWLQQARPALAIPSAVHEVSPPPPSPAWYRTRRWQGVALAAVVLTVAGALARPRPLAAADLHVELTPAGVIARNAAGVEQWLHAFPSTETTFFPESPVQVVGGPDEAVYVATSHRTRSGGDRVDGGELSVLDAAGGLRRSFSFKDDVTFGGTSYGAPWAISGFAVRQGPQGSRVAVTAHHYFWDPGILTILDENWQRLGTFVHAGWLEQVRWVTPNRLMVAGFSNARDGGMVALLDASALDGQGPTDPGTRHFCESCPGGRPLRMLVFPRSEVNRLSASRFNRVRIQTFADGRIAAHTVEMPSDTGDAAALYELSASLESVTARFNERYWDIHAALEREGKIDHTRAECPDRDGPRGVEVWTEAGGWQTITQTH